MRSFEERMAEIHRRSEKIKKERKAFRSRLLLICLPLALCVGIGAVAILGGAGSNGAGALLPEGAPLQSGSDTVTAGDVAYTRLDIRRSSALLDDAVQTRSDVATVCAVYDILVERYRGFGAAESVGESATDNYAVSGEETPKDSNALVGEYTFTFSSPGGEEAVFTLVGDLLTDQTRGESYRLPAEQLEKLWQALDLEGGAQQ